MKIREIEVLDWRGLDARLSLSDGGTIVEAPNERGKSRLFEALVFALTESAKGKAHYKEVLRTRGGDPGRLPTVRLRFEHGGRRWELRKRFLSGRNDALLREETSGREWAGDAADERLAALLQTRPAKGKQRHPGMWSGAQGLGPWPLLLVRQRRAYQLPTDPAGRGGLPEDTHTTLHGLLRRELGDAAMGLHGEALLRAVQERYGPLAPDQRRSKDGKLVGRKHTPLGDAEARYERALEGYRAAIEQWRQARRIDEHFAEATAQRERAEAEIRLARRQLEEIREQLARLEKAEQQAEAAERNRNEAKRRCQEAAERLASREMLEHTLKARRTQRATLEREIDELSEARRELEQKLESSRSEREHLRNHVKAMRRRHAELHEAWRRRDLWSECLLLEENARAARKAHDALLRAHAASKALERYDERRRRILRERLDALHEAEATLRRQSIRVRLTPLRAGLRLNDRALPPEGVVDLRIGARETLELADSEGPVATVEVVDRSTDRETLHAKLQEAKRLFEQVVEELGLPPDDPADALARFEQLAEQREAARRTEREARARLAARLGCEEDLEPSEFAERLATLQQRIAELRREAAPPMDEEATTSNEREALEVTLRRTRVNLDEAERSLEHNEERERELLASLEPLEERQREIEARLLSRDLDVRGPEAKLEDLPSSAELAAELRAREADLRCHEEALRKAHAHIAELGGERLRMERADMEAAIARLEDELGRWKEKRAELLGKRAQIVGEGNLRGRLVERGEELLEAARTLRRARARVLALRWLQEQLWERRHQAEHAIFEPVFAELRGSIRQVFGPDARLDVAPSLQRGGRSTMLLRRGARAIEHELLSAGAQEQLALMVRVALARVWHRSLGEGEALPLLLDDPLSESDERRLPQVAKLLLDATREGLQVVVLTCRAAPYLKGAPGFVRARLQPIEEPGAATP